MRYALTLAVAAAVTCVMPAAARADDGQSGASAEDLARAKALFDEATGALQAGRFAEAAKSLRLSLALAPRAATAFNLGVALRGTGDAIGAVDMFTRLLAGEFGPVEPARRGQVESLSEQVSAEIATLTIGVAGADAAELRVDGRLIRVARDGQQLVVNVNPGTHHLVASARDRETVDRAIEVGPGARLDVRIALSPQRDLRPGHVVLTCPDDSATVSIDHVGAAHLRLETDLPPGEYKVRVKNGAGEHVVTLLVPAGRVVKLDLDAPARSLLQRPWFWIGAGALVAGGAVAVVVATRPRDRDPVSDPVWGVTTTGFGF